MTAHTLTRPAAETTGPNTWDGLLTLATWWNDGELDNAAAGTVAEMVRVFAPKIAAERDDVKVMSIFLDLATEVRILAEFEDGDLTWEEVLPDASGTDREGQALTAARDRMNATLTELTGRTA